MSRTLHIPLTFALLGLLFSGTTPLDIRADRVELKHAEGVVKFEGNVVATQKRLELRCDAVTARYRDDGELVGLEASGDVRVTAEGLSARARHAKYDRDAGTLVLTGEPQVTRGEDQLRGARIVFWPDEGRMVVEQARGVFAAPDLGGVARTRHPRAKP